MEFTLEFERSGDFIGVARSHGVELVFDTGHGIDKQGLWPMEVLVASLGGCLNLDLGAALQESDYAVDQLTMTITGHRDDSTSPLPLTRREHSWTLHSPIGASGSNSAVVEVHMTRKSLGLISVILVVVLGLGALIAVPAVRADTTAPVSAADKAIADAKLATLKALGQQIREAAKAVQEKVKAAKAAGIDLSAFRADIAKALKGGQHLRIDFKRMQKPQLTDAERVQLKAIEVRVIELKKQLKAKIDAKAPQAEIEVLKAQLKAVIAEREALVKAFRAGARAHFLASGKSVTMQGWIPACAGMTDRKVVAALFLSSPRRRGPTSLVCCRRHYHAILRLRW
ncbi:MAG: hypothetical protein NTX94_03870 [Caldiserica bacterium]|nr:hypothetical protein [Caldisericota bacterium]